MGNIQYKKLKRQYSTNNGISWNDLQPYAYKVGDILQENSNCVARIYRKIDADPSASFDCDESGNKYNITLYQYSDNDGMTWITYKQERGDLNESLSEDCGVVYRWENVENEYICEVIDDNDLIFTSWWYLEDVLNGTNTTVFWLNDVQYRTKESPYSVSLKDLGINELTSCKKGFRQNDGRSSLVELLSFPDTSKVTDMSEMFASNEKMTTLDLSYFNTSKVTNMYRMFHYCEGLTSLDVSNFNTSNVTNMSCMFRGCRRLTSLDVSKWDTSKVTDMSWMFEQCEILSTLDLSNFNTSAVTDMSYMFAKCNSLTSLDLSNFNTSNVTNMAFMFEGFDSLATLDLSNFNTSNVTNMGGMFRYITSVDVLILDGWDMTNVTDTHSMFTSSYRLNKIYMRGCNQTTINKIQSALLSDTYAPDNVTIITE